MLLVTVIVPAYNEAENLPVLHEQLTRVAAGVPGYQFEFLFVDDGSTDATAAVLARLRNMDSRVKTVRFSRNFGSHAACLAGLLHAGGDAAVNLSADLQDPPEMIPKMLACIEQGADVVFAVRDRREDPWLTIRLANLYHRMMRRLAIPNWPLGGFDFVMMRRAVREVVVQWRQRNTSLFAQLLWVGFRQAYVPYIRQRRRAGRSKWTLKKKVKLAVDSLMSFSFVPIRIITYSGILLSAAGVAYALFVILSSILLGAAVEGWTQLMVVFLAVSGFQLFMLGVIGEYLWRVADEVRGGPAFVIESTSGFDLTGDSARRQVNWTDAFPSKPVNPA